MVTQAAPDFTAPSQEGQLPTIQNGIYYQENPKIAEVRLKRPRDLRDPNRLHQKATHGQHCPPPGQGTTRQRGLS